MSETLNPDGTPVLIEYVFYRHFVVYVDEADSVEEAQRILDSGEDYGGLSSVGVFVAGEPRSVGPWAWSSPTPEQAQDMRNDYAKAKR